MRASAELLSRLATETGFQAGTLEKVVRLGELAADVTRHPLLADALVLKGGTALNLCWGVPQRLSVDLDYNYIGAPDRAGMLEARPRIEQAMEELSRRREYRVQRSSEAFAGRKLYLGYTSALGGAERIEIDLNFIFRVSVAGIEDRSLWQPGGLDRPVIRVVSLTELLIGKLLALLDRAAPRDVWDVARLPDVARELLETPAFRARFLALAATLDHPPATYTRERTVGRVTDRAVREQLLPMLVTGDSVDTTSMENQAWSIVEPLLQLTPEETQFFDAIDKGELRLELLGDPAALELKQHPAIAWKLRNVRTHRRRGSTARGPVAPRNRRRED